MALELAVISPDVVLNNPPFCSTRTPLTVVNGVQAIPVIKFQEKRPLKAKASCQLQHIGWEKGD
jgi:hypothetical protein